MVFLHVLINLQASVLLMIILIIFALTPTLLSATITPSQNFPPIAKPNCTDRCGNIRIPFPFGTMQECYQNYSFWVTCNETFNPPKLFMQNISAEITSISLDGQLKVLQFVGHDCYARNGSRISTNSPSIKLPIYLTVNYTANLFTMVGCDAYGFVSGSRLNRYYTIGCTALCAAKDDMMEGSCRGLGCCQTSIPEDVWSVDVELESYWNYGKVWDFNNCGYAFLVEANAFNFSKENLTNLKNVESLPMVVDWAIGNGTCEEAQMSTTYACASRNSTCYNPENGYGYRCRCLGGYEGNPYIVDGCQATIPLSQNFPIAKPNCADRCGDIRIPFPFGTTEDCYQSRSFLVTCKHTFNSQKLFWGNSSVEITDISPDGQLKILQFMARDCYARDGSSISRRSPWISLPIYFTVNNTANKFTIVGCDAYAFVSGRRLNLNYTTGCSATCEAKDDAKEGSCMGLGCCQTSIPEDVWKVEVELRSYWNYSRVSDFNNCSYAFLVEESAFRFSPENLTNLKNVEKLPMVVDWASGIGTCKEGQMNSSAYACKSRNSICYDPENGYGYRCRCQEGYGGNPYLSDGCQDIDECRDRTQNDCTIKESCKNTAGNYTCSCPKGYSGNGRVPDGCTKEQDMKIASTKKQDMKIAYVLIGIAFGITALLLAAILLHMELRRRRSKSTKQKFFLQNGGMLLQEKLTRRERSSDMVKIFSSSELEKATNDFHNNMIIGQGGFGTVYKGVLTDNKIVAIKKSKRVDPNQIEQFINEVFVLSQVNHRNVVRLLGCCLETEVPLLVYEFISNGTLSSHIHNQAKAHFLYWDMRLKIAAETAGVLSYLHSAASTPIIHRDVKPDNILLDHTFTAKVSDFGASKLVPLDLTQLSTVVQGTLGYLDPEYLQTNQLTEKSDVYSFGVVLLELLTGRKAISFDKPEEEKILANFFLSILKQERLFEILDGNIVGDGNMEQISEVARLAKGCLNVKGEDRPSMKEVAMELEGLILGGKHSWARNEDNAEEMESLLGKGVGLNPFANGEGNSTSVGYDSICSNVDPMSGGR